MKFAGDVEVTMDEDSLFVLLDGDLLGV